MKDHLETWAVAAVSRDATALAIRTKNALEGYSVTVYTLEKYSQKGTEIIEGSMTDFFGQIMEEYDVILCIMATGIVVRSIAPYLGHKSTDPAILVMDAKGKFVISLLSGHLGGANDAAVLLSRRMDATPVITTGTDVKGSMAVDVLAEKIKCAIADFTDAKDVTAAILDDEKVSIEDRIGLNFTGIVLPDNILLLDQPGADETKWRILIDDAMNPEMEDGIHYVQLVPKTLIVGIGCKRNTSGEHIIEEMETLLEKKNQHPSSVRFFATIGLKADEAGIQKAVEKFGAELKVVSDEFVKMVQSHFEGSDFVEKTIGLRAVSEPCGYVASGFGECVQPKVKCGGLTLSFWKSKNIREN